MASLKRLFTLSQAPEQISEQAWRALRLTQIMALVLLGLMGLFVMTALAALFIPQQVAETAVITELALAMLASVLTLAFALWSLHLGLWESFKGGRILIAEAIFLGFSMAGILALIGVIYLVTH